MTKQYYIDNDNKLYIYTNSGPPYYTAQPIIHVKGWNTVSKNPLGEIDTEVCNISLPNGFWKEISKHEAIARLQMMAIRAWSNSEPQRLMYEDGFLMEHSNGEYVLYDDIKDELNPPDEMQDLLLVCIRLMEE